MKLNFVVNSERRKKIWNLINSIVTIKNKIYELERQEEERRKLKKKLHEVKG